VESCQVSVSELSMSGRMSCYPFGLTIKCTCDNRGRPLQCLPVLDYSVGLSVGGAGGHQGGGGGGPGHDLWGDMMLGADDMDDGDSRFSREQETEVILAFTLLVTILLTFLGFIIHRCERLSYKRNCKSCPESQMLPVNHSSVCVQTDQTNEHGTYEDPFPLLSHLTTLPLGDETTSPPTNKTSYTTSTGQSLPHIYPHISGHEPDVEAGYLNRASQDGLDQQME